MTDFPSQLPRAAAALPRRSFLRVAGASAAAVGLVLTGCVDSDPEPITTPTVLSFGNDADPNKQLLNYLFFIKQLEYAFYNKVIGALPSGLAAAEQAHLRDLRDHELVHRQVLGNVLGASALAEVPFEFTSVTLTTRTGVLEAAKKLEDTASAAFLGVLPLISNVTIFTIASKMASVEARHAALVRDLLTPGSFADEEVVTVDGASAGQAVAFTPTQVAAVLAPFLPSLTINIDTLPTA